MSTEEPQLVKSVGIATENAYPIEFTERNQWLKWRYDNGKCPYQNGHRVDYTNPNYWLSYHTIDNSDKVGFVLSESDPYAVIDLDDCINENGVHPVARAILRKADSFSDISVSGSGIHIYIKAELPDGIKTVQSELPADSDYPEAKIEAYDRKRFIVISGQKIADSPHSIKPRQGLLTELVEKYGPDPSERKRTQTEASHTDSGDPIDLSNDRVATARAILRDFYTDSWTTNRAQSYLNRLIDGDYSEFNGDRSKAEATMATILYGIFYWYGDGDAIDLVRQYLKNVGSENPYTKDGQPRKFRRSDKYIRGLADYAADTFDLDKFRRYQRRKEKWRYSRDYSDLTYHYVLEAVHHLAEKNPTRREIVDYCQLMDSDRSRRTHQEALSRLVNKFQLVDMDDSENPPVYSPKNLSSPQATGT